VAGYRSILDTIVLPRWRDVPLRDIRFDGLQVWIASLSVDGSARFEGKGLSASRVRQTHQLVGAVLKFAVKGKHLPANPAEGVELPRIAETEQRYLTHEQLHRLAIAAGRFRTFVFTLGYCGLRFGEAAALRVSDVNLTDRRIRVRRSVTHVPGRGLSRGLRRTTARVLCRCQRSWPSCWRLRSPTVTAVSWRFHRAVVVL
jgi:integrase